MKAGDAAAAERLFAEVLEAQEQEAAAIAARAADKRREAAKAARNIAALARASNVGKAARLLQTRGHARSGRRADVGRYARAAMDAGRTEEGKAAFEQAASRTRDGNDPRLHYWATLGLGDVALAQGNLPSARRHYETAAAIAEPIAKADPGSGSGASPGNAGWQRDLSVSHNKIGDVLVEQGNLPAALDAYQRLASPSANASPRPTPAMPDGSATSPSRITRSATCSVPRATSPQPSTPTSASLAIAERLAKADPGQCRMAARPLRLA